MKRAMKVDETDTFRFSDLTVPSQTTLFELEPNYEQLKRLIVNKFRGKKASIEVIEDFVVVETPFRETHFKRQILREMEYVDPPEIEIVESPRNRGGTYSKGTIIRFL